MQNKVAQITQEVVADKLLWGLWRSIAEDYKKRYLKTIWEQFENAIRSSSYTDSLKEFLDKFKKSIPVDLQAQFNKEILSVVESGQDEVVLNWFRTEITYLVILVRMRNQKRKEDYQVDQIYEIGGGLFDVEIIEEVSREFNVSVAKLTESWEAHSDSVGEFWAKVDKEVLISLITK